MALRSRRSRKSGRTTAGAALALVFIWVVARTLSDRFFISQPLTWIPTAALLAAIPLIAALGVRSLARRPVSWLLVALTWAVMLGWFTHTHCRLFSAQPRSDKPAVAMMHWNMSWPSRRTWGQYVEAIKDQPNQDLIFLTNPIPSRRYFQQLYPDQYPGYHAARGQRQIVLSTFEIIASADASLRVPHPSDFASFPIDLPPDEPDVVSSLAPQVPDPAWYDEGRVLFAIIDTSAPLGRPITVWFVDLPSHPRLDRARLIRYVKNRIDWLVSNPKLPEFEPFAKPDLIVGDFNTPRGSASLDALCGELENAFDDAGRGSDFTWPRRFPLYHIDQIFLRRPLRAVAYDVRDPGISGHRMQLIEIVSE